MDDRPLGQFKITVEERNFGSLYKWTAHIRTYGHSPFLPCGAVHLDASKITYTYRPNGQHFSAHLDQRLFRQSKITLVGSNFGLYKSTVVERNFRPSKMTVVDHNFGPSKTRVMDRYFEPSKITVVYHNFGPSIFLFIKKKGTVQMDNIYS